MRTNILALTILLSGTLGLVSCSSDTQPASDPMKLSPPTFTKGDKEIPWDLFESSVGKSLDLEDRLKFKSVPDGHIQILATCTQGSRALNSETLVPLKTDIAVYEFFALKTLAFIESGDSLQCSFKFSAVNSSGSKHVFPLQGVEITDVGQHQIDVVDASGNKIEQAAADDRSIQVKVWGPNYDTAVLQCRDARWSVPPMGSEFPLTRLMILDPQFDHTDPEHENLAKRPVQRCRVVTVKNRVVSISGMFSLVQENAPTVSVKTLGGGTPNSREVKPQLASFTITNPQQNTLRIKVPKAGPAPSIDVYTRYNQSGMKPDRMGHSQFGGSTRIHLQSNGGELVNESADFYWIDLPAQQGADFLVSAALAKKWCQGVYGVVVSLVEPIPIQISEDWEFGNLEATFANVDLTKKIIFGSSGASTEPAMCSRN